MVAFDSAFPVIRAARRERVRCARGCGGAGRSPRVPVRTFDALSLPHVALVRIRDPGWNPLVYAQQTRDLRLESAPAPNLLRDKGTRWAVVIGISNHENLPPAAQLHFAHRDAQEFAAFLRSASGGAIPGANIRLLVNEQATLAEIRASLAHLARGRRKT